MLEKRLSYFEKVDTMSAEGLKKLANIKNKKETEDKQDVKTIKNNSEDWVKSWGPMERMIQKQYD